MRIQHNIAGINAYRNVGINQSNVTKNLEKLSSGYAVNRAGDGAAELAISEGMRCKIRGLEQAGENIEDGINLIHVAEGAMQEIHSILNRMVTLCTKASNCIYTDTERACIQEEINELQDEMQRITDSTEFGGIKLFPEGEPTENGVIIQNKTKLPSWVKEEGTSFNAGVGRLADTYVVKGTVHAAAFLNFDALDASNVNDLIGTGFHTTCFTCDNYYSIQFVSGTGYSMEKSGTHYVYNVGIDGVTTGEQLIEKIKAATNNGNPRGHYTVFSYYEDKTWSSKSMLVIYDNRAYNDANMKKYPNNGKVGDGVAYSAEDVELCDIIFQIGSEQEEILKVQLPNISLRDLGMSGSSVSCLTQAKSRSSMKIVQNAIDTVSVERGRMGAYENRLEHTYSSLTVTKENITVAESRVRDTDMAEEIAAYTKNNILAQAAQAMLTQANTIPNAVIRLFQG